MSYFYAFLGFAALIVLHEAGHFAAAKAVGMRVEKFSLFFGPMWIKRRRGDTEYGIGWIPLGGYVKITGMSPGEIFETPEIEARAYVNQPVWKRIVVILAGPVVNLVLAFVLALAFFMSQHQHVIGTSNTIAQVVAKTPAAAALRGGDLIVSVDGKKLGADGIREAIEKHTCADGAKADGCSAATPITVVVKRDGVLHTYRLRPAYVKSAGAMQLGFAFLGKFAGNGVVYSSGQSVSGLWRVTKATVSDLSQLFRSKERSQLHGVVGGYERTEAAFQQSTSEALEVLALISLSLGIINLFPFLPLDGGHIFWAVVEKLRGKRVPFVVMERAGLVGFRADPSAVRDRLEQRPLLTRRELRQSLSPGLRGLQ